MVSHTFRVADAALALETALDADNATKVLISNVLGPLALTVLSFIHRTDAATADRETRGTKRAAHMRLYEYARRTTGGVPL